VYHELTDQEIRHRRTMLLLRVAVVVAVAVGIWLLAVLAQRAAREQAAASMRQSILDAAMQCCAVEGSYPSSITHLEDAYGLRINSSDYIITYESFASNVMPSVVVVPR
jgi:transcriptional regulator of nitric oxide reductase